MRRQVGNKTELVRTRPAPESLQAGHDIYAMLKAYKIENPHITKTYIWLDGAGNLHNAALLALFADSEAHTGIRVLEVNHNEGACSKLHVDAHRHMDETCALLCRRRRGQEGSGHQV